MPWTMLESTPAETLRDALRQRLGDFEADALFAVRSSASDEDQAVRSFAGAYRTVLGVPADDVFAAMSEVVSSFSAPRAREYRNRHGLPADHGHMAVVVQQMVPAEVSGVAFTRDPVSGEEVVVVEACPGLGEPLVSGRLNPDVFRIRRAPRRAEAIRVGSKELRADLGAGGGVHEHEQPPGPRHLPCLDFDQMREVVDGALAAEALFGCALDLEFSFSEGHLWWLQARPQRPLTASTR